ncbi:MAG: hypothetical protein LBP24_00575 [Coriobacteriales bacterium]|jgi:hypothetical protein|nr:hypothetical protein [Coriobacteriales bacterium]
MQKAMGELLSMLATELPEDTKNLVKHRTTIVLFSICLAVGLVILCYSLWVGYSQNKAVAELRAGELAIHDKLWYARLLHMRAAANPDVDATSYKVSIESNPGLYTHAEFVMDHPPLEERAPGTLYFAPDKEGMTQKYLDRLNALIASDPGIVSDKDFEYPLVLEDVVDDYEAVKAVFNRMSAAQILYFNGILDELPSVSEAADAFASPQLGEG